MTAQDDSRKGASSGGARSSWTEGGEPPRRDGYGQRSGGSGGFSGTHALGTETHPEQRRGQQDESFDHEYRRWRDEQAHGMDRDYHAWRSQRFSSDFREWRAIRAAQAGLRTGSGPPVTHADRERELRGDGDDQSGR